MAVTHHESQRTGRERELVTPALFLQDVSPAAKKMRQKVYETIRALASLGAGRSSGVRRPVRAAAEAEAAARPLAVPAGEGGNLLAQDTRAGPGGHLLELGLVKRP